LQPKADAGFTAPQLLDSGSTEFAGRGAIWAIAHYLSLLIWKILHYGAGFPGRGQLKSMQAIQRLRQECRKLSYALTLLPSAPANPQ
jgi:hypothetical protein